MFIFKSNLRDLVEPTVDALYGLATQSKEQIKLKFLKIRTSVKGKLNRFFYLFNQHRCRNEPLKQIEDGCNEAEEQKKDEEEEEEEEHNGRTQLSQTQKNQHIDLQNHLER